MLYHNLMTGDDTRLSILPDSHLTPYKKTITENLLFSVSVQAGVELSHLFGICTALNYSDNQLGK